jgi:hypothetical protein
MEHLNCEIHQVITVSELISREFFKQYMTCSTSADLLFITVNTNLELRSEGFKLLQTNTHPDLNQTMPIQTFSVLFMSYIKKSVTSNPTNSVTFCEENRILSMCNNCDPWPLRVLLWQLCYFHRYLHKVICSEALLLCKCSCFLHNRTHLFKLEMEMYLKS